MLIVEDQYYLATDMCDWLEGAGASIIGPAPDAEQACQLIQKDAPDTAVVDINLGRGPTYEVADELAERRVSFLFATGYDTAAIPAQFQEAPRIEKPFNGSDLVEAVRALTAPR